MPNASGDPHPVLRWTEGGETRTARWHSESGTPPPARVVVADDQLTADDAQVLASQGTALLWRGDFQNARQLLIALARRVDRPPRRPRKPAVSHPPAVTGGCLPPPAPGAVAARTHAGPAADPARRGLRHSVAACARHPAGLHRSLGSGRRTFGRLAAGAARDRRRARMAPQGNRDPGGWRPHPSALRRVRADSPRIRRAGREGALAGVDVVVRRGVRHRHRDRRARRGARAARRPARGRHRPGSPCAGVRPRQPRPPRAGGSGGRHRGGSLSRRAGRARRVQPALDSGAAELADRAWDLRPRQPDAARIPRRAARAPRAGGRGLGDPVGSRGASRAAVEGGAARRVRRRGVCTSSGASTCGRAIPGLPTRATRCTPRAPPR